MEIKRKGNISDNIGARKTITVAMMVLNEDSVLQGCMDNIFANMTFDEIVVVDGGSEDRTLKILERYEEQVNNMKIRQHEWEGDWAKQRNRTLEYSTSDWIMVTAPDERFEVGLRKIMWWALGQDRYTGFIFPRYSFWMDYEHVRNEWYPDLQLRLFENQPNIKYVNTYPPEAPQEEKYAHDALTGLTGQMYTTIHHIAHLNGLRGSEHWKQLLAKHNIDAGDFKVEDCLENWHVIGYKEFNAKIRGLLNWRQFVKAQKGE